MPLTYVSLADKYIGKYHVFTPKQVAIADREEVIHKELFPDLTLNQWLEVFPNAKPPARRGIMRKIAQLVHDLREAEVIKKTFNNNILSGIRYQDKWFYSMVRDILYVNPLFEGREQAIKRCHFQLADLASLASLDSRPAQDGRITQQNIDKAKSVPLSSLYSGKLRKLNNTLVGLCPFHIDHDPSFFIYTKTNTWWCYSENIGGDPITFIRKQHGLSFPQAVKYLIKS